MPYPSDLRFRPATIRDAEAIAKLHADSWRRHYRGAYTDDYLDGDVVSDRLAVWTGRLLKPDARTRTIVADDGDSLVGFAHVVLEADPTWGALVDNLHVTYQRKRRGIGRRLLALAAEAAIELTSGLYLWVLEQNTDARAFYQARGAKCVERAPVPPPGGIANRLNGSPFGLRCAWPDPTTLRIQRCPIRGCLSKVCGAGQAGGMDSPWASARGRYAGVVLLTRRGMGSAGDRYWVALDDGAATNVTAQVTDRDTADALRPGDRVEVTVDPRRRRLLDHVVVDPARR